MPTTIKVRYFLYLLIAVAIFAIFASITTSQVYNLWKAMAWFGMVAYIALTVLLLWLGYFAIQVIIDDYEQEKRITNIVGLHPSQLPEWKWQALAKPIAMEMLSEKAEALRSLDIVEKSHLANKNPDPQMILINDQSFKGLKEQFWELQNLFLKFKVDVPKKSWKDWGPFSY